MTNQMNTVSVGINLFCTKGTIDKINRSIRSSIHRVEDVGSRIEITFSLYKDALVVRRLIDKMASELAHKEALAAQIFIGKMANKFAYDLLISIAA